METRKDRLVKAFDELRYLKKIKSQTDFGEQLDYNKSYVSELFNERKPITEGVANAIQTKFAINADWLLKGEGEMFGKPTPQEPPKEIDILIKTVQSLATSVAEDRTMVKKRFELVETNLKAHGTALESLLEWKNLADDTFEEIAAQLKPLTDAAFRKAAVSSGGKQKGT